MGVMALFYSPQQPIFNRKAHSDAKFMTYLSGSPDDFATEFS
jgi:hypothetical protein